MLCIYLMIRIYIRGISHESGTCDHVLYSYHYVTATQCVIVSQVSGVPLCNQVIQGRISSEFTTLVIFTLQYWLEIYHCQLCQPEHHLQ